MKTKRLLQTISFTLALILSLQLIPPTLLSDWGLHVQAIDATTVQGYSYFTPQASDNTIDAVLPNTFIDETVPQSVPTMTADDQRYIDLVRRNCSFQDLPTDDAAFLVQYTGITLENFCLATVDGMPLADSINLLTLAEVSGYSVPEIAVLELSIDDYITITSQFDLYNSCISPEIDAGLDSELRSYILLGNTCEQVLNAYATSQVLSIEMPPLLEPAAEQDIPTALNSTDALLVRNFSNELNISSAAVATQLVAKGIPATDLAEKKFAINLEKSKLLVVPLGATPCTVGYTAFPEIIESPYNYSYNENEKVSLNSGALILSYTDYILPGVNGLDLVISRTYNSQDASMYTPVINLLDDYYFDYISYRNCLYTALEENTHLNTLNGLGQGWSFGFSSIEIIGNTTVLHCADGSSYEVAGWENKTAIFKDYKLKDKTLKYGSAIFSNNHVPAYYVLTYGDGKCEYFSMDGKLIGIQDRHGNTITLVHKIYNGYPHITITDTMGRLVTISGTSTDTGHIMTVSLPDDVTLTYDVQDYYESSGSCLAAYTDPVGNTTYYGYTVQSAGVNLLEKELGVVNNVFFNLSTVTHPTHAQTCYTYSTTGRNLGKGGLMIAWRISARLDKLDTTNTNFCNILLYSYPLNDYSGYPGYENPNLLPDDFIYFAVVENECGTKTSTVFGKDHTIINATRTHTGNLVQITEYAYNDNKLPVRTTVRRYNPETSAYMETIELAEYDEYGNIVAKWSTLANGDKSKTDYKTTYSYDTEHNLLLSQSYKTNSTTTVAVTNTLDADRKNIIRTDVTVNGVLLRRTDYSYDSYGNVTCAKQYYSANAYTQTNYTYNGGNLIRSDILTADGSISTTNTYDTLGRLVSKTDGRGYTTHYTYDAAGNITSIQNPDNTTVIYIRDYTNNAVTVTDENGHQLKYTYTPLGLEYEVIDVATNLVISRKSYDNKNRLISLEEYVYGSVTKYTYDAFDRITDESVWQGETMLSRTQYGYDDAAYDGQFRQVIKTIAGDQNAPNVVTSQYTDKHGNMVATGQVLGGAEYIDTYAYDYAGNALIYRSAADIGANRDHTTSYTYNGLGQVTATYNSLNQSTTSEYDMLGRVVRTTDHAGTPTEYTYDELGRLTSQTITIEDGFTATTYYDYDAAGNLITEWKPVQASGESPAWEKTTYTYDSRNRLIGVTQYSGNNPVSVTRYTYDGVGNMLTSTTGLTSLIDFGGQTTYYAYDCFGNVTAMKDALGKVECYAYSKLGKLLSKTDRNGIETYYGYDALGRVVATATNDAFVYRGYTLTGEVLWEQSNTQQTFYAYDELGRVTSVSETETTRPAHPAYLDANGGSVVFVWVDSSYLIPSQLPVPTRTGYTFMGWYYEGMLLSGNDPVSVTPGSSLVAAWQANTYTIVYHGNEGTLPDGQTEYTQLCTYDQFFALVENRFSRPGHRFAYWLHRESGTALTEEQGGLWNLTTVPNGEIHLYAEWTDLALSPYIVTMDSNGGSEIEGTIEVLPGTAIVPPAPTRTGYTFMGWFLDDEPVEIISEQTISADCTLTAQWMPNQYCISYDLNGASSRPGESSPRDQLCAYDEPAVLTSTVPFRPGYTFLGWGLSRTGPAVYAAGEVVLNLSATPDDTVTLYAIWKSVGSVTPGSGSMYSLRGDTTALTAYIKYYAYDIAGNRTGFALTVGDEIVHNVTYAYDELNRLTAIADKGVMEAWYAYDANGNRSAVAYANGTITTYTYNKANWVTGIFNMQGETALSAYAYTYYASGNRRTENDHNGVCTAYAYDGLGRLVREWDSVGLDICYTYDAAGNRTRMTVSGPENYTTAYTYDANNRLTEEVTTRGGLPFSTLYAYDGNGNLLATSDRNGVVSNAHAYNGFNQLVSTSSGGIQTHYTYNAQGIRTGKVTLNDATSFLLDGGNVVGEVQNGVLSASYLRGVNLIRRTTMAGEEYYLFNGHGDVVTLTDGSGALTKSYDYDAFGNEKNPDSTDTNPFRYCGEYFDTETGTYYLRARYYDPEIGRFTQQDTHWSPANAIYGDNPRKVYERTDALGLSTYSYAPEISAIMQSGNLYVYCVNSPVLYSDHSGQSATLTLTWTSGMWWLAGADALLPIGDVIYIAGISICSIVDAVNTIGIDNIAALVSNAEAGVSNAADCIQKAFGGGTSSPASPPPDPDDPERNWESVKEKHLEKKLKEQGTDPHKIKQEYLGKKAPIKKYDIYVDKTSGQLAIFEKATGKLVEVTHYYIK